MKSILINTHSPEETKSLAERLGVFFKPGDVIMLTGDLAAGKTHFVKSIAEKFGTSASVSSPTYTIAHHYPSDKCPVLHIDAYRLSGPDEFRDLTLDDYFPESLTAVEWGDLIDGVFKDYLKISFSFSGESDTSRQIKISAHGRQWGDKFPEISEALKGELI